MGVFGFIDIEGRNYPQVIMGEDKFTGWFGKDMFSSEESRAAAYKKTLQTAYKTGVRGFSISPHDTLIEVLKGFRKENQDIICIANPHWQSHYYIDDESMWLPKNLERLSATIAKRLPDISHGWFIGKQDVFTEKEVDSIRLDQEEHKRRLDMFGFCDFCLVGNLGRSALLLLGREDIIRKEIVCVRDKGMVPIGICEAAIALPNMERLDIGGTWTWLNKDFSCPDTKTAQDLIAKANKPVTAYRVLSSPTGFDLDASIRFILNQPKIRSMVIGIKNPAEAGDTFSKLKEILG